MRLRATITVDYEADARLYGTTDAAEAAVIDLDGFTDPRYFLDLGVVRVTVDPVAESVEA